MLGRFMGLFKLASPGVGDSQPRRHICSCPSNHLCKYNTINHGILGVVCLGLMSSLNGARVTSRAVFSCQLRMRESSKRSLGSASSSRYSLTSAS